MMDLEKMKAAAEKYAGKYKPPFIAVDTGTDMGAEVYDADEKHVITCGFIGDPNPIWRPFMEQAEYIAAVPPDVLLALIEGNERLRSGGRNLTDEEVLAWFDRNAPLAENVTDLRAAIDDAATLIWRTP